MKTQLIYLLLLIAPLWSNSAYSAIAAVGPAKITFIENGWSGEGFAIHLSQGIAGCSAPPTEFGVDASHPAYKELVALLMSAYFTEKPIEVVVNTGNCTLGARTSITSIRLR